MLASALIAGHSELAMQLALRLHAALRWLQTVHSPQATAIASVVGRLNRE